MNVISNDISKEHIILNFSCNFISTIILDRNYSNNYTNNILSCRINILTESGWIHDDFGFNFSCNEDILIDLTAIIYSNSDTNFQDVTIEFFSSGSGSILNIDDLRNYRIENILKCCKIDMIWTIINEYKAKYKNPTKQFMNMTTNQLLEIDKTELINIGGHTLSHPVLSNENEHIAKLLRKKSVLMVAYGACAAFGGIPGLANVTSKNKILEAVYQDTATTVNPDRTRPQTHYVSPEGHALELPELFENVKALDDVVEVDYIIGACPPTREMNVKLLDVVLDFVHGKADLPPKGIILASERTLCEECPRQKYFLLFLVE